MKSPPSFTNVEWDELKVNDTIIYTSYISSGKLFFKPALPEKLAGTVGGSESEIAGSLVRDFWTGIEYGRVLEFLGRLRNRGHRLIARWGDSERSCLKPLEIRKRGVQSWVGSSGSGNEPWNRARNGNHRPA